MGALADLQKFKKKLDIAIESSLADDVADIVKEEMVTQIQDKVYSNYSPSFYHRRKEQGGLIDKSNMYSYVDNQKTLIVRNVTQDTNHMAPINTQNAYGGNVATVVEQGIGYTWIGSEIYSMQPFPRPFHEPTEKAVAEKGTAKTALIMGLRKRGINTD